MFGRDSWALFGPLAATMTLAAACGTSGDNAYTCECQCTEIFDDTAPPPGLAFHQGVCADSEEEARSLAGCGIQCSEESFINPGWTCGFTGRIVETRIDACVEVSRDPLLELETEGPIFSWGTVTHKSWVTVTTKDGWSVLTPSGTVHFDENGCYPGIDCAFDITSMELTAPQFTHGGRTIDHLLLLNQGRFTGTRNAYGEVRLPGTAPIEISGSVDGHHGVKELYATGHVTGHLHPDRLTLSGNYADAEGEAGFYLEIVFEGGAGYRVPQPLFLVDIVFAANIPLVTVDASYSFLPEGQIERWQWSYFDSDNQAKRFLGDRPLLETKANELPTDIELGLRGSNGMASFTPVCIAPGPHDKCETGEEMSASCDSCVRQICEADEYCCKVAWDQICVNEVASICDRSCQ